MAIEFENKKFSLFSILTISSIGITNTVSPIIVLALKNEWKHILEENIKILPYNRILDE